MMSRNILLTQGQFAIVDNQDFDTINAFKWYATWDPKMGSYYAERTIRVDGKRTKQKMHRFIMGLGPGNVDKRQVDHINHCTLDNRRDNLLVKTNRGNQENRRDNTSGYPGVCLNRRVNKWISYTRVNGVAHYLGYFTDPIAASRARQEFIEKNNLR